MPRGREAVGCNIRGRPHPGRVSLAKSISPTPTSLGGIAMPGPPDAMLDQLRRSNRRWKRLALASLAVLALAVVGWMATAVVQERQTAAARSEAEVAKREADRVRAAERYAKRQAQQALYFTRLAL